MLGVSQHVSNNTIERYAKICGVVHKFIPPCKNVFQIILISLMLAYKNAQKPVAIAG